MNQEIQDAIASLQLWKMEGNAISRTLRFESFPQAIEFMRLAVPYCEQLNHHPDWTNCYNRLDIALTTHDKGGLTEKDVSLARSLDALAERFKLT